MIHPCRDIWIKMGLKYTAMSSHGDEMSHLASDPADVQ